MVAFATDPQTERSLLRSAGCSRDGGGAVSSSRPRPCFAGIGSSRVAGGSDGEPSEVWGTNIPIGLVGAPDAGRPREDRHGLSLKVARDPAVIALSSPGRPIETASAG